MTRDGMLQPTYNELRAMYDGQCQLTDEWARKYHALKFKKSDAGLKARIDELEKALAVVNARLASASLRIATLDPGAKALVTPAAPEQHKEGAA